MQGSCLCGSVRYAVEAPFKLFQYCHCSRCRKISGSAHSANLLVVPEQFRWLTGQELVGSYDVPGAKYLKTAFCRQCGGRLPWEAKGGKTMVVPAGTLDEDPGIKPQWNIFCGSRVAWFVESGTLPQYEELPERK
jgi:hypothetical protein